MAEGLKRNRYAQGDLFICDLTDVILKDDMASMEHPFYSLSKKPDREPRRYTKGDSWIEFRPSIKGLPTIYDKDLIIYAISQVIAKTEKGQPAPKTVEIDPYAFLVFTHRGTGGRDYDALCDSLDRLDGTRFRTNVLFDGVRQDDWMGLIDRASLKTEEVTNPKTGEVKHKPRSLKITLSDMMLEAIERRQVLTLHRDYFLLTRPIQRRLYEIARKHCGHQAEWSCSLEILLQKSGSRSSAKREFRRSIKQEAERNCLPDYELKFDAENDVVIFRKRSSMPLPLGQDDSNISPLDGETYLEARQHAPGWDVRVLEQEWRKWCSNEEIMPKRPDAHYLKFCKSWYEKRGRP